MDRRTTMVMDELGIDKGIRSLIDRLWAHGYRTLKSCDGDSGRAYVLFDSESGDGWLEAKAGSLGFSKVSSAGDCCKGEIERVREEISSFGKAPDDFVDLGKSCSSCGAGINRYVVYEKR